MRIQSLAWSLWLVASCGVARESLGALPEAGSAGRKRGVIVAGSGGTPARDAGEPDPSTNGGRGPVTDAGEPDPTPNRDAGSAADSGSVAPDKCAAQGCNANAQPLENYCGHEHAGCPQTLGSGRATACDPVFSEKGPLGRRLYQQRGVLPNACGGTTVRLRLEYGTVEYHYGADEKLRAVTTLTPTTAGPCAAAFYRYGDIGCAPAGDAQDIGCDS